MKKFLKVFLFWSLYYCVIEEDYFSEKRGKIRWKFKFYPRKISITLFYLLMSPIVFIKSGYEGVINSWENIYRVESWSNYKMWGKTKPSKFDCYVLF